MVKVVPQINLQTVWFVPKACFIWYKMSRVLALSSVDFWEPKRAKVQSCERGLRLDLLLARFSLLVVPVYLSLYFCISLLILNLGFQ